jgi:glyoxylase-like metal-dependent hydrolase (beta-lactamase superfamily II)
MSSTMMDRRFFIMWIAALTASASKDSLVAQDKPPLPLIQSDPPLQIADAVWVISDKRIPLVPNVGIVVGAESALVIDCGLGPVNGEKVLEVARRLAPRRNLILTVTHFHPEHGFGAQVFEKDAKIYYNKEQREELAQKGDRYIGMFRGLLGPAAGVLDGTRIVMPHAVYEGPRSEIDLGGRRVEFINWGMAHSRGDQVIFLPQERILFAGDLLEERIFPIFPWFPPDDVDIDAANWMRILNAFEQLNPARIVPGHGSISGLELPRTVHSYMSDLGRQVSDRRSQGRPVDAVIAELRPAILNKYPDWEQPQWIDFAIRYMYEKS